MNRILVPLSTLALALFAGGCLVEPFAEPAREPAAPREAPPRTSPPTPPPAQQAPDPAATAAARTLSDAFAEVARVATPAVVSVEVEHRSRPAADLPEMFRGGPQRPSAGRGSGAIVDPEGLILTNNHVIEDAARIRVVMADGSEWTATVVGADPPTDLAVLRIQAEDRAFPWLPIGDSEEVRVGDWVLAIGNPLGNSHSVTAGIVSAKGRVLGGDYQDFIQTDAAINRGNSGGPLVNLDGQLVGVNSVIQTLAQMGGAAGNIGIGFSIPSNLARRVYDELATEGEVTRGWLGVSVRPVDAEVARALFLDESVRGAVIVDFSGADSPAEKAGLARQDVIVRFNDRVVENSRDLQFAVADARPGETSRVEILRGGETLELPVVLARRDLEQAAPIQGGGEEPAEPQSDPGGRLGIAGETLTPRLAGQVGADFEGVLVRRVAGDGAAALAGIEPGYVITEVNGEQVRGVEDLAAALAPIPAGASFAVWFAFPTGQAEWARSFAIVEMPDGE